MKPYHDDVLPRVPSLFDSVSGWKEERGEGRRGVKLTMMKNLMIDDL